MCGGHRGLGIGHIQLADKSGAEELLRDFGGVLLRKTGEVRAVDGVDFSLQSGDCLALFGPNGAGKTTLLRIAAGLLKPTAGTITVGGRSLRDDAAARGRVGLVSHQSMLYRALTSRENVEFAARLYGLPDPHTAATRALERLKMLDRANAPVRALSDQRRPA